MEENFYMANLSDISFDNHPKMYPKWKRVWFALVAWWKSTF
jgi:hypothetical protein